MRWFFNLRRLYDESMLSAIEARALGTQPVAEAPAVDLSLATIVDAAGTSAVGAFDQYLNPGDPGANRSSVWSVDGSSAYVDLDMSSAQRMESF
mmetsp:Transcript_7959/g.26181  ORF Transcript_7959/g.26181 Transcript_7959/m.26181 type:complete len:94 (+) Transcript_7959:24-305(+)